MKNIQKITGIITLAIITVFLMASCGDPVAQADLGIYNIGDTGPGGGLIFYVDEDDEFPGWTYLEAAPVDLSPRYWSSSSIDSPGTLKELGKGSNNTIIITLTHWTENSSNNAAWACNVFTGLNNTKDWFLPTVDELELMYQNLHLRGLGNFQTSEYWSSWVDDESANSSQAYSFNFSNGYHRSDVKFVRNRIRPIRSF